FSFTMPAQDVTLVAVFEEVVVEPETFILSLVASPEGAGILTGDGEYLAGQEILLSAVAAEGFAFLNWTSDGEVISEAADFSFTMPAQDVTLVAVFEEVVVEPDTFILSLEASPEGAGTLGGDGEYLAGQEILLSAVAAEGVTFLSWTSNGEVISEAADFSFTMPAQDVTLVAVFEEVVVEPETFTLSLVALPEGAGILTGDGEYQAGQEVLLSALANEGFIFLNWTWNEMTVSSSEQFQFTMPAEDVTLVAHFMEDILPGYCAYSHGYWFANKDIVWPFDLVIGGKTFTQKEGQKFWPPNTPAKRAFTRFAAVTLSEVLVSEFPELQAAMQVIDHYFATTYPRNPSGNVNKAAGYLEKWIDQNNCDNQIEISHAEFFEQIPPSVLQERSDQAQLQVFPNPFREKLTFRVTAVVDAQAKLELFDMTGALIEVVFEGPVQANQMIEKQYISQLSNATFLFYRLTIGNEVSTGKVMYQK
ncbi:MAG: T9SS type A sorting domain-containing protein, partial [Bacteroidales bacterium]|nr:T9SS type A sorting domain-containing protein [Bacteroidales bacterium]